MRRLFWGALGLAALGLVLTAPGAAAHALLSTSDPVGGSTVATSPKVVTLTFTEEPDPRLVLVHVLDSGGRTVERGSAQPLPGRPDTLQIPVKELGQGVYTVTWRTTSAVDGHTTAGSFSFGVGVAPSAATTGAGTSATKAPRTPAPSPVAVTGRWSLYVGLSLLVGSAAFWFLVAPLASGARLVPAGWLLAAAGVVLIGSEQRRNAGVSLSRLLSSDVGHKLEVLAAAVVVAGVAAAAFTWRRSRWTALFLGAAGAAAMLARAASGHAEAASPRWLAVGAQWAHIAAVGVWLGGLAVLIGSGRARELVGRFSRVATVALAVVVVTGTVRAWDEVGALGRLLSTSFGVALLVKLGLVAAVVALAVVNRRRAGSRSLAAEAAVAACVFAATGVLAGLAPSRSVAEAGRPAAAAAPVVVTGSDFATSVRVRLSVSPGTVGVNRFDLSVVDYDTRQPVEATAVTLRAQPVDRPDIPVGTLPLTKVGPGRWQATGTALSLDGRWRVTVALDKAGGGIEVPLELATKQPPQRVDVSRTPGLPTIYTITVGGQQLQAYVDQGRVGDNEVHLTFIDADADPVALTARQGKGAARDVSLRRLEAGHYVGDVTLTAGRWHFEVGATLAGGAPFRASFDTDIAG
ncbi:MAG TPA: copper resistance protein CopC [Acidimicrobiales bacterium]|nr:copper resistance protein CopC [Acidimicrobiales bacterium]